MTRLSRTKDRAAEIFADGRDVVAERAVGARDTVVDASHRSVEKMSDRPLLTLAGGVVGGIVVGIVIGAMLPKSRFETRAFGDTSRRLTASARDMVSNARDAGGERLGDLDFDIDRIADGVRDLLGRALDAAKDVADSASDTISSVRDKR